MKSFIVGFTQCVINTTSYYASRHVEASSVTGYFLHFEKSFSYAFTAVPALVSGASVSCVQASAVPACCS